MNRIVVAAALALAVILKTAPAQAQRARVFVASYGSDNNPCTFGSPCKTFQQAVNVVAHGGEVTAIDSAGFGTFTISHAVTITSPNGVEAGIAAPIGGGAAITINAGTNDVVRLNGLTLDGANVENSNGILFNSGGTLEVRNSVIRNFGLEGINFQPGTGTASQLLVSETLLADNGDIGLKVQASYSVTGALDRVTAENNTNGGIGLFASSASNLTISNSLVANNSGPDACGIGVLGQGSDAIFTLTIGDSVIENNPNGLCAEASSVTTLRNSTISGALSGIQTFGGAVWVSRSTISGNGAALSGTNGGAVFSFGDNNLAYNTNYSAFTMPMQAYK